jgi:dehydrogenase/reductase SDR family protein 7B
VSQSFYQGKVVWITGASSGIGESLAYALSKSGALLVLSARRQQELERVKASCTRPQDVEIVTMDQTDGASVSEAVGKVYTLHQRVDILFNNGGISQRSEALKTPESVERKIFEVNYFSNVLLSKLVATKMIAAGGGCIAITSSLTGKYGFYLRSSYAAAKHALHGYYDSLRMETSDQGLRIVLILPGLIATPISVSAVNEQGVGTGQMDRNQSEGTSPDVCAEQILQGIAAGKDEFGVGGKELLTLKLRRFFPGILEKILRRRSAR